MLMFEGWLIAVEVLVLILVLVPLGAVGHVERGDDGEWFFGVAGLLSGGVRLLLGSGGWELVAGLNIAGYDGCACACWDGNVVAIIDVWWNIRKVLRMTEGSARRPNHRRWERT